MTLTTSTPMPAFSPAESASAALGDLPVWKLSDLYPSVDSTEYKVDL